MQPLKIVPLIARSPAPFAALLGPERLQELEATAVTLRRRLGGRAIWNVNSTAAGGGVAEMLHSLLAYARGFEVDARWVVISGTDEFFKITKRFKNDEDGAVTVDWVVLTAAIVGLGVAVIASVRTATTTLGDKISTAVESQTVDGA